MVKSFTQNHESLPENVNGIRRSFNEVVRLGLNILPKKFEILFKSIDEPFVLPIDSKHIYDDDYTLEDYDGKLIKSSDEMFEKSQCIRENYSKIRNNHSFLLDCHNMNLVPKSIPVLADCKLSKCFHDIIVPIFEMRIEEMVNEGSVIPWEERKMASVFKGSNTGMRVDEKLSYRKNSRVLLVDWSKKTKHKTEISFTGYHCRGGEIFCEKFKKEYPLGNILDYAEQQKFKYNIVVDGCAWAGRLPNIISNGFLTFYHSIWLSWSNTVLRQFEHYIPLPATGNYDHLEKVLDYFGENDNEAKGIAMDGMKFAQKMMRKEDKIAYILLVMLEYAHLSEDTVY